MIIIRITTVITLINSLTSHITVAITNIMIIRIRLCMTTVLFVSVLLLL